MNYNAKARREYYKYNDMSFNEFKLKYSNKTDIEVLNIAIQRHKDYTNLITGYSQNK